MKKTIFFSLLLILLLIQNIYSQDTSIVRYLPLNVGNIWVYHYSGFNAGIPVSGYEKVSIIGTEILGSKTYYKFNYSYKIISGPPNPVYSYFYMSSGPGYIRIDSITGNIMQWEVCGTGMGYLRDSLNVGTSSYYTDCIAPIPPKDLALANQGSITVFGLTKYYKLVQTKPPVSFWFIQRRFIKDIGLYYTNDEWQLHDVDKYLYGCVINGILYGDTTYASIIDVKKISEEIPRNYKFSQNYPNPFNPTTNIKYDVPHSSLVRLEVFDELGKFVKVLVNERQSPGTYEVSFDGSPFPSGVYFYRLTTDNYSESKKMLMIK